MLSLGETDKPDIQTVLECANIKSGKYELSLQRPVEAHFQQERYKDCLADCERSLAGGQGPTFELQKAYLVNSHFRLEKVLQIEQVDCGQRCWCPGSLILHIQPSAMRLLHERLDYCPYCIRILP